MHEKKTLNEKESRNTWAQAQLLYTFFCNDLAMRLAYRQDISVIAANGTRAL